MSDEKTKAEAAQEKVDAQRAKLERLDEHIGALMTKRADAEEKLAQLIKSANTAIIKARGRS